MSVIFYKDAIHIAANLTNQLNEIASNENNTQFKNKMIPSQMSYQLVMAVKKKMFRLKLTKR